MDKTPVDATDPIDQLRAGGRTELARILLATMPGGSEGL